MDPVSCHTCWWADFNTDTNSHHIVEEPDIFNMKSEKDTTTIRVIKSCAVGQLAWKINSFQNWCPKHALFTVMENRQRRLRGGIQAAGKEAWEGRTSRTKIVNNSSMFMFLQEMVEDSNQAYDFLVDVYAAFGGSSPADVLDFFGRLNDMNIRGRQIDVIIERWLPDGADSWSLSRIMQLIKENPKEIVDYVNEHFDKADVEEAVIEGASVYGHA
jgi:hypothetical protein